MIKKIVKCILPKRIRARGFETVHDIYTRPGVMQLDGKQRTSMTVGCRDADYIPKVDGAGKVFKNNEGVQLQKMHNGILVESGGYYGDWMVEIIKTLKGHHEPQEEKVFHEVLKKIGANSTMVELGAHWGYYSNWFNKEKKGAVNYCFEPDPGYMDGGIRNSNHNSTNLKYVHAAAGRTGTKNLRFYPETMPGEGLDVPVISVDEAVKKYKLEKIDLLHMDIQGAELDALEGAVESIKKNKIRFVFVSTHHHSISNDPLTHIKVLRFLESYGASIVCAHSVHESFSGDGLVVASFSKKDSNFKVDVSHNTSGNALFIDTEQDLAELARSYVKLYDTFIG